MSLKSYTHVDARMVVRGTTEADSVAKAQLAGHLLLRALKDPTDTTLAARGTGNQRFLNLTALAGSRRVVGGWLAARGLLGGPTLGGLLLGFLRSSLGFSFSLRTGGGLGGHRRVAGGVGAGRRRVAGVASVVVGSIGCCTLGSSVRHDEREERKEQKRSCEKRESLLRIQADQKAESKSITSEKLFKEM
jgi:hypothetical protein